MGSSRTTRRKILEQAAIMTKASTSTSLLFFNIDCTFTTGSVAFKATNYILDEN